MRRFGPWLVLLALLAPGAVGQATNSKKAKELKSKLSSVRGHAAEVRAELREKKREVWQAAEDMETLDTQISRLDESIEDTRDNLERERSEQAQLKSQLAASEAKLEERRRQAARRIRSMYMATDESALSVLVGARDLADFAARKALLERIAQHDRDLFEQVKRLRDEVKTKKTKQDALVLSIAKLESRQVTEQAKLDAVRVRKDDLLGRLRNERSALEEELAEMEIASKRLQAQILAFQNANRGRVAVYRGGFSSPVSGRLSSGFGYRIHPITRTRRLHTGIDIAAPTGSPIRAAGSGVVITAGWMRGYGNTVVIDHGGGRSTLYGHCSRLFVRSGQKVTSGERIASVGSTGFSTGPHLHFEVRMNGVPVNPAGR